jgi:hypothetical protein
MIVLPYRIFNRAQQSETDWNSYPNLRCSHISNEMLHMMSKLRQTGLLPSKRMAMIGLVALTLVLAGCGGGGGGGGTTAGGGAGTATEGGGAATEAPAETTMMGGGMEGTTMMGGGMEGTTMMGGGMEGTPLEGTTMTG